MRKLLLLTILLMCIGCGEVGLPNSASPYSGIPSPTTRNMPTPQAQIPQETMTIVQATRARTLEDLPEPRVSPSTIHTSFREFHEINEDELTSALMIGRLAYIYKTEDNTTFIRVIDTLNSKSQEYMVEGRLTSLKWSVNGEYLGWVARRWRPNYEISVWILQVTSGKYEMIVPWSGKELGFSWSPTSDALFVTSSVYPSPEFEGTVVDLSGLRGVKYYWFDNLDYRQYIDFSLSPDWKSAVFHGRKGRNLKLITENGVERDIFQVPVDFDGFESISWSNSGEFLVFSLYQEKNGNTGMDGYLYSIQGGLIQNLVSSSGIIGNFEWSQSDVYISYEIIDSMLLFCIRNPEYSLDVCYKSFFSGMDLVWISDKRIVTSTNKIDGDWNVFIIDVENSNITKLANPNDEIRTDATVWLPSGNSP